MNGSDSGEPEWPIRPERRAEPVQRDVPRDREETTTVVTPRKRRINPVLIALVGLVLLLALLWLFSGNKSADQDKLIGNEGGEQAAADNPEKRCASKATYDLIKRDLFRRAAQVRGSDQAAFDRLSAHAALRMENPVMLTENSGNKAVQCSGSLALDLPPGVAVAGGRRSLTADIDYAVQPAADGSGSVVTLRNADAIVTPLATLGRVAQPVQEPRTTNDDVLDEPADPSPPPPDAAQPGPFAPAPQPAPDRPSGARPSFNCANASTRGEREVCSDAGLASLDRQMAAQFGRAMSAASPSQRRLLEQTRGRFLGYRDRCPNRACIGDAYTGRMREIRDIMEGNWQPR